MFYIFIKVVVTEVYKSVKIHQTVTLNIYVFHCMKIYLYLKNNLFMW